MKRLSCLWPEILTQVVLVSSSLQWPEVLKIAIVLIFVMQDNELFIKWREIQLITYVQPTML